jgi:formiminoglutamase
MYRPTDPTLWTGRLDADEGPRALRWHQKVKPLPRPAGATIGVAEEPGTAGVAPGIALLGFACDVGVARNHGRPGSAEGPAALRRALANLAWHGEAPVWDAGDVLCEGEALEDAQAELGAHVAALLEGGHRPVVLGGGHELAYGSFLGLAAHASLRGGRASSSRPAPPVIGVINVDAHLDLREGARATSGTPFRQIAEACGARGLPFRYLCLGLDEDATTDALLDGAARRGVRVVRDRELLAPGGLAAAQAAIAAFLEEVELVQLSIDLDALPAGEVPGVSAPAARGVPLWVVEALLDAVVRSGKVAVGEVAELCPRLDLDGRSAKVGARVVARVAQARLSP